MAKLPKLEADCYYGDPEAPLPDWRQSDSNEDEAPRLTKAEQRALASILAVEPRELWEEEK